MQKETDEYLTSDGNNWGYLLNDDLSYLQEVFNHDLLESAILKSSKGLYNALKDMGEQPYIDRCYDLIEKKWEKDQFIHKLLMNNLTVILLELIINEKDLKLLGKKICYDKTIHFNIPKVIADNKMTEFVMQYVKTENEEVKEGFYNRVKLEHGYTIDFFTSEKIVIFLSMTKTELI